MPPTFRYLKNYFISFSFILEQKTTWIWMDTLKMKNKIKKFMQKHTQKAVFGEPQWKSNKF